MTRIGGRVHEIRPRATTTTTVSFFISISNHRRSLARSRSRWLFGSAAAVRGLQAKKMTGPQRVLPSSASMTDPTTLAAFLFSVVAHHVDPAPARRARVRQRQRWH